MPRSALLSRNTNTNTAPAPTPTIRFTPPPAPISSHDAMLAASSLPPTSLAPRAAAEPRKRLVPKKSKLGLLSVGRRADDLSDVTRRVGAEEARGFDIYVDRCRDAEDASILMVRKKKSRAALGSVAWSADENAVPPPAPVEPKNEGKMERLKVPGEKEGKWWSIGRGRRESKNKENLVPRSKTPEPFSKPATEAEPRVRFNSLDSSRLLGVSTFPATQASPPPPPVPPKDYPTIKSQRQRSGTLSSLSTLFTSTGSDEGYLTPPTPVEQGTNQGSIALRAMRSMRSMARMKSWANLGSDKPAPNQEGNTSTPTSTTLKPKKKKTKEKEREKEKEKEKEKDTKKKSRAAKTLSAGSFEAGVLAAPQSSPHADQATPRPNSRLALSTLLPGSLRLRTASRSSSGSSRLASPIVLPNHTLYAPGADDSADASRTSASSRLTSTQGLYALPDPRLSADSSADVVLRPTSAWSNSVSSHGSSLRPASSTSGESVRRSARSSSSSASVRWDEDGIARARMRLERGEKRMEIPKRAAVADIFPEARVGKTSTESMAPPVIRFEKEESVREESDGEKTPVKAKPRPVSEQLLNRSRPKAFSDNAEGVISILDQATNELASLINRLDLEATPSSIQGSPIKSLRDVPSNDSFSRAGEDSPLKRRHHTLGKQRSVLFCPQDRTTSIASLRTFAETQLKTNLAAPTTRQQPMSELDARRMMVGQQIAPWSELDWHVSPKKPAAAKTFRPGHKRTVTPTPETDFGPAFHPLRPAAPERISHVESAPCTGVTPLPTQSTAPSSQTFGASGRIGRRASADEGYDDAAPPSPSPTFRAKRHSRRPSVLSVMCDTGAALPLEALKSLGLSGTLGGPEPEVDEEDPDSDIPDELQVIISSQSDGERSPGREEEFDFAARRAPSPGRPPRTALPALSPELKRASAPAVFRAPVPEPESDADSGSEDDTGRSFDFTGELKRLSEGGGSNRRSFVEQLENAFRTPADVQLGLELGAGLFLRKDPQPLAALPLVHREDPEEDLVPQSVTEIDEESFNVESCGEQSVVSEQSGDVSVQHSEQPESFRHSMASMDTLEHLLAECEEDICRHYSEMRDHSSIRSKESDGRLNTSFKFGGRPSIPSFIEESTEDKPLTLSDIIPPPSHTRTHSRSSVLDDDSVLKSLLAKVYDDDSSVVDSIKAHAQAAPPARPRVDSGASSHFDLNSARLSYASTHSRNSSEVSFKGFAAFEEVRRGFEFHANRPTFYPPPGATSSRVWQGKRDSMFSVGSVSSYGNTLNSGATDPFGYAPSRPDSFSDEHSLSMSLNVDDTFSFLKKDPYRKRVDSDASSHLLRSSSLRSNRHNESSLSWAAPAGPPISMYNRSFGGLHRNGSDASMSSVAHSYAMHGGRAAWARHHNNNSGDSLFSDVSAPQVARPGLGDKMFEMADYGMPLTSITASPTASAYSERQSFSPSDNQSNRDSVYSIAPSVSVAGDSIFSQTAFKSPCGSDEDVFSFDVSGSEPQESSSARLFQFRPISMMSVSSVNSIPRDDDTVVTMLGGGHVRRRSIDSCIDGSPSRALERQRRKHTALQHLARLMQFDHGDDELPSSIPDRLSRVSFEEAGNRLSQASLEEAFSAMVSPEKPVQDRMSKASPQKTHAVKPSIASTSSYQFESEKMIVRGKGLLERNNVEENALMPPTNDYLTPFERPPVFTQPDRGRARSNTVTSIDSGAETPPLLLSDNSSVSSGSQSSIDVGHLNNLLTSVAYPSSGLARAGSVRPRARGAGHRRGVSHHRVSRTSVYETIIEESVVLSSSPSFENPSAPEDGLSRHSSHHSLVQRDSVYIVDAETASIMSDDTGMITMRKYYALREEVDETVAESKKAWIDTPFSMFAMQAFDPPSNLNSMKAILEQSQQNYGPLPSELRPRRIRSRTSSRTSPYPVRSRRVSQEQPTPVFVPRKPFTSPSPRSKSAAPRHPISINPNISNPSLNVPAAPTSGVKVFSAPPPAESKKPSPFSVFVDTENTVSPQRDTESAPTRQRVTSSARRTALGWSKKNVVKNAAKSPSKSPAKSIAAKAAAVKTAASKVAAAKANTGSEKENATANGTMLTPKDTLRISRPRPKAARRPNPARSALMI